MPTKAAYLAIDEDPDAHFEMFLAEKLHKTLGEIGDMPNEEYIRWYVWFARKQQMRESREVSGGGD